MPTVTEKIQYALQGPSEDILTQRGTKPDATHPEFWSDGRSGIELLHTNVTKALRDMGITDAQFEVVRRRVITVITDPEIVED